nr:MAG TPA: hypothetical protein [Caudoviricetes sp.]
MTSLSLLFSTTPIHKLFRICLNRTQKELFVLSFLFS